MALKTSVLIVGDDTSDRGELYDLLKIQGYAPFAVSTCEQALNYVRKSPPAAALVYLWLSDLPGHVVIHGIRQASAQTECIALVTSPTQQNAAHEALRTGAFLFLRRAYDNEQLLAVLTRAVEKHENTQALKDVKERVAILFDSLPAGVLIIEARTRAVIDANPEAVRMIGLPKAEIIGSLCRSRAMRGAGETGEAASDEAPSTECVIPATHTVAEIMLGGRKHFVEGFVDVSGKLRIEDKMHEQEALSLLLMDHVHDVVMTVGPDRKITGTAVGVRDAPKRVHVGSDSLALIPSSCRERYRRGLERIFQEGEAEAFSQGMPPLESWSIRMEPVRSRGEVIAAAVRVRDLNARERTVEKLEFRSAAVEKTTQALLVINAEGVIVDANPAACDLLEYLQGEIIGTSFSQVEEPSDVRWEDWWRKLSLEERMSYESKFRTRNGRNIPVRADANYAMIEGTAMCFVFVEDVSGEHNLEDVVHSIASKENTYLAAIQDAAVMIDREGRILNLNTTAAERFGGSIDSVIGSNYYRLIPETAARFRKGRVDEVFVRDREIHFEDRLGSDILENTVCPVRDQENLITQVLLVSRDITEHRGQWARIEGIWNSSNVPLFEFDFSKLRHDISAIAGQDNPDTYLRKQTDLVRSCISKIIVRDINPQALDMLGVGAAEEIRDHVEGLFTPTGAIQMIGGLVMLYSAGSIVDFEQQFRAPGGHTADAMLRLIVNHGPADEWRHVLGVLVDISALRETRERLVEASFGEKARLAEDISKTVGTTLKASTVLGGKLENGLAKTRSPYAEHAKNLQAKLGEMQEQLDLVLSDVESQASSGDTLISSLRKLGEHTQKRHGVTCNCNLSAIGLVRDRGLASHLFHIAREAVDYAMRHHQPSEISITITAAHRGGILIVRDNGNGLAEIDHEDIALVLMRTHAALIDAELARAKSKQGGNEQTCIFRAPGF